MIINPAAPTTFFLPVGIETDIDGPAATGIYVGQPFGGCWTPPRARSAHYRVVWLGVRCETWHWTRVTPRETRQEVRR